MCMIRSLIHHGRDLTDRFDAWWRGVAERRRMAREFARLDDRDVARVLADIGCSREDLNAIIANAPLSRPLLEGMVARLGVAEAYARAEAGLVREVERRCTTCSAQARCRRWLRGAGGREDNAAFCPNAESFAHLAKDSTARVA
jgi:uncharacterized protein YjiS (DUF1127 family)